jgi:hypothetical protein
MRFRFTFACANVWNSIRVELFSISISNRLQLNSRSGQPARKKMDLKILILTIAVAVSAQETTGENEKISITAFNADGKQILNCRAVAINLRFVLLTASCANEVSYLDFNNNIGRYHKEKAIIHPGYRSGEWRSDNVGIVKVSSARQLAPGIFHNYFVISLTET